MRDADASRMSEGMGRGLTSFNAPYTVGALRPLKNLSKRGPNSFASVDTSDNIFGMLLGLRPKNPDVPMPLREP